MPKGAFLPVPVICTVYFGAPLARIQDEPKEQFLDRARAAVINLATEPNRASEATSNPTAQDRA